MYSGDQWEEAIIFALEKRIKGGVRLSEGVIGEITVQGWERVRKAMWERTFCPKAQSYITGDLKDHRMSERKTI